ncbi:MAG TPA: hypothetical protein VLC09_09645, partial [Polyangiaceae bacterium]|nr:hypothetical protein [Polyangiaceae bacterium]
MRDSLGLVSLALVGLLAACTPSSRSTEPGDSAATSSTAATSSPASSTQPASPAASLAPVQPS